MLLLYPHMIGMIFILIGTFIEETSSSLGKWNVMHKKESVYTFGFLNLFWALIFFIAFAIYRGAFVFSLDALWIFAIYAVLEIAQTFSSVEATVKAERSTFGFIMVGTIPLLLAIDYFLGYNISIFNLLGVLIIIIGLFILFENHGLSKKGIGFVIFSTINAAITISLYKYLITYYNSVEAQSIVALSIVLIFLFIMAKWKAKENPLKFIFKRGFFFQSLNRGVSSVLISFAYLFAPASFIATGKRGLAVLWSIISGNMFFHEKHIVLKILSFILVISGLVLLIV